MPWNMIPPHTKTIPHRPPPGLRCICHNEIYGKAHLRDDASIAPYEFHFITRLFVSPKNKRMQRCSFPLHLCILILYDFISMATPHNSRLAA